MINREEWGIVAEAALDKARDYSVLAGQYRRENRLRMADFYSRKSNRIYDIIVKIDKENKNARAEV